MAQYTKRQIASHIYDLFAERPETIRATRWACVIKNGKLTIVRRLMVMPTDIIITESVLEPVQSPSWFSIYYSVWKNWYKLITSDIKI
jgi:hypothetical protein